MKQSPTQRTMFVTRSLTVQAKDGPENVLVEMHPDLSRQVKAAAKEAGTSLDSFLKQLIKGYRLNGQRLVDHQSLARLMDKWNVK